MDAKYFNPQQEETELIRSLRSEVHQVKDCFTRFSIQALVFSAAAFGLIVHFQKEEPRIGWVSLFLIVVLMAIGRIGTHKYGTANRNAGFELFLKQRKSLQDFSRSGWVSSERNIGWEEAMNAWRVIQTTVYEYIFQSKWYWPHNLKKEHKSRKNIWFDLGDQVKGSSSVYYPGSFLKTMLYVLYSATIFAGVDIILMIFLIHGETGWSKETILTVLISSVWAIGTGIYISKLEERRNNLEKGFLSIYSCSIIWHAVNAAHYQALKTSFANGSGIFSNYQSYLTNLALEAHDLTQGNNVFEIFNWIEKKGDLRNSKRISLALRQ